MNRRDLLWMGTATTVTHGLLNLGCSNASVSADRPKHAGHAQQASTGGAAAGHAHAANLTDPALQQLLEAATECVRAGELCLSHCLQMFATGHTDMAACAQSVRDMIPVCSATATLAAASSQHLHAMAGVCAQVCASCIAACKPHQNAPSCAGCLEACERMRQALTDLPTRKT